MILKMYRTEGISGFYKGLLPSLLMTCNPILQFTLYEILRDKVIKSGLDLSSKYIIIISLISKIITTFSTYPMLTIKTLFQANETKTDNELFSIIKDMMKKDGVFGLFKGKDFILK